LVTELLPSERIESAFATLQLGLRDVGFLSKNRLEKTQKKLAKFTASNKSPGQTTDNPEKVLTPKSRFRYNGGLQLNSIHINSQLHEKEIRFKICLF